MYGGSVTQSLGFSEVASTFFIVAVNHLQGNFEKQNSPLHSSYSTLL